MTVIQEKTKLQHHRVRNIFTALLLMSIMDFLAASFELYRKALKLASRNEK